MGDKKGRLARSKKGKEGLIRDHARGPVEQRGCRSVEPLDDAGCAERKIPGSGGLVELTEFVSELLEGRAGLAQLQILRLQLCTAESQLIGES